MEAITGVSVGLLTIWDMVKAVEKDEDGQYPDTRISEIKVIIKEKIYMWVFIIFDMIKEKTVVYKVTKEEIIIEIYDKILSRGKDIIPLIEEKLLNN